MIINAVIVTYNRKKLLCRCIDAVLSQSVSIAHLYIIDNASTDGTHEFLIQNGFASENSANSPKTVNNTNIHYIHLEQNSGGAGGFNTGMQCANQPGTDYLWIMDDDGYPSERCLENLLKQTGTHEYLMPISISTEEKDRLTWYIRKKNKKLTRSYAELRESFVNNLLPHAVPFNGLLISTQLVNKVGYPKKEMFIWGDDFEYQYRCMKTGVEPITVLNAIFFHPSDKATCLRIFFGLIPITYSDSKLRFTCLIRNSTYNYWNYKGKYIILIKFFLYSWLFLIKKRFAVRDYVYYLKCVKDGIKGDFTRHVQFTK